MNALRNHLQNKLLAGALAAGPIVIIVWGAVWIEQQTRPLATLLGFPYPGLGILLALVGVYLLGLAVTSLVGGFFLWILDAVLRRVPGLNLLYNAWKDVLVLPPGKTGVYHQVVLVPGPAGRNQLGFTSGETVPGAPETWCVFVPGVPNPIVGQLVVMKRDACQPLNLSVEEAFKFLLSTGNYLPAGLEGTSPAAQ